MKKIGITVLAACVALASFAHTNALEDAWLKGTTDKVPTSYKTGETMVFTIEPQDIKGELPAGAYFLKWERSGDDGVSEKGSEPLTGKPFVYKTRIAKPGFVRLYAEVVDASGRNQESVIESAKEIIDAGLPHSDPLPVFILIP